MILARVFFLTLSLILSLSFFIHALPDQQETALSLGAMVGVGVFLVQLIIEAWWSRRSPKALSTFLVGLAFSYLTGQIFSWMAGAVLEVSQLGLSPIVYQGVLVSFFLLGGYMGAITVLRTEGRWSLLLPFVRLVGQQEESKGILLDASLLEDVRFFELVRSKFLNAPMVFPKFFLKDLCASLEEGDEERKIQAKKSLDTFRKLEELAGTSLTLDETDYPEIEDSLAKVARLAKDKKMRLFVADGTKIEVLSGGKVDVISLQALYRILKPTMQAGELLKIKIQRHGKESRQGVGYLDDGTMVVVNGGGDFIGDHVKARILSVKQTSAGHIIFCNLLENDLTVLQEEEFLNKVLLRG